MIEVQNLSCGYNNKIVLQDISFTLEKGEAICVLGANGAGKTTLLKTLLGLLPLKGGCINIEGQTNMSHQNLAKLVAYVPQAKMVFYQHSVEDVIMMGRARHIKTFDVPKENDYKIVQDAMASLNILHLFGMQYSNLSGGEQQLVLIARALVQGTPYLLLDEPASNLDLANQSLLMKTVNNLKKQTVGVLMISHVPTHAFSCCDKTLIVYHDGTSECGITENIVTTERLKKAYNTDVEIIDGRSTMGKTVHTYII